MNYDLFEGREKSVSGKNYLVKFTKKYDQFKKINGNRVINRGVVSRLIDSIETHGYLMNPILVNEKNEIIDGQHRHSALQELGIEIPYIVLSGYNGKEMQVLNQTGSNWGTKDFLDYWITQNKKDYSLCKEFSIKYDVFSLATSIFLLSGESASYKEIGKDGHKENLFNSGKWKIVNLKDAVSLADFLLDIQPLHPEGYNGPHLAKAILFLEGKYPDYFDRNEFKDKLMHRSNMLQKQTNWSHYIAPINDIYNLRRRGEKVFMNSSLY